MSNNIHTKLLEIQAGLVVPKEQNNTHLNFKYRNLEDIMKAVKPLLKRVGMSLTISDEIKQVADRIYVIATATLTDIGTGQAIETSASAREMESKRGLDEAQVTGSASSYARKYCLNGMFCIDDTKDADSMDNSYYQNNDLIFEFSKLNENPAMEGKRDETRKAWKICNTDKDSEVVLARMRNTIKIVEEAKVSKESAKKEKV
tara:strand:+ start:330 stop:938 length:609 start_codon:yes stop_codon:yes gene_type:complete